MKPRQADTHRHAFNALKVTEKSARTFEQVKAAQERKAELNYAKHKPGSQCEAWAKQRSSVHAPNAEKDAGQLRETRVIQRIVLWEHDGICTSLTSGMA